MLVILIMVLITIVLFVIPAILEKFTDCNSSWVFRGSGICISIVTMIFLLFAIMENLPLNKESKYIGYTERYNTIMVALEDGEDLTLLTSEISDYNTEVLRGRKFHNNPWVGWFYNGVYDELPLITIEEKN